MNVLVYSNPEYSIEDDYYFLKLFKDYDNSKLIINFSYEDPHSPELKKLNEYFDLNNVIGEGSELNKLASLKRCVVENISSKGKNLTNRLYDDLDCIEIINQSKKDGYSLNCRYISYIFMQLLLALGFKARWVMCLPMDLRDDECHCVTEVYSKELEKWIVVDAAFDLFYFNKKGIPMNLAEMRKTLIEENKLKFFSPNKEYSYFIQNYWKKNIFRFKYLINNKYNALASSQIEFACLNPDNFVLKNKEFILNGKTNILNYYYNETMFYKGENV